jgi:hypothetical protein
MTTLTDLQISFETRASAFATAHSIPIAIENVVFTKPVSGNWLECFVHISLITDRDVNSTETSVFGFFEVNIWQQVGKGTKAGNVLLDALLETFQTGEVVSGVTIYGADVGSNVTNVPGWFATPVLFKFRLET